MLSAEGNGYKDHYYGNTASLPPEMRAERGYGPAVPGTIP